jgi:fructoselysine-6-P-deglycase FrlB-like protein
MAAAIQKSRNVLLLGMGASHFVNQIFAFQIRKMGIEASAIPASEFLYDPIPVNNKIVILTSQSGESIETVKCLPDLSNIDVYSVTLTADSTIAKQTKSVICSGGGEKAYAVHEV